jgi:hypothetical protein
VPRVCYMPGPAAAVGGGYGMLEFKLAVSATFLVSLLILIDRCAAKINFFCSVVRCTTMAVDSIGLLVFLPENPEKISISTRDYRKVAFSASANPPFGFSLFDLFDNSASRPFFIVYLLLTFVQVQ